MYRDVFVYLQGGEADVSALAAAAALAAARDGHVSALAAVVHPVPVASEWGVSAVALDPAAQRAASAAAEAAADAARRQLQAAGVRHEVRGVDAPLAWPEEIAALHARHADLCVYGRPRATDGRFAAGFEALLMHGGRPVLLMPAGAALPVPVPRAMVAWQPRREATRALHDALPLLAPGAAVELALVDPEPALLGHGDEPGADIARHLARHGLATRVSALARAGRDTGEALLAHARETAAPLLVMGGYSHSRWRQQVFGGTTRTVLARATGPVLLSH